jgi:transmembrane sensor
MHDDLRQAAARRITEEAAQWLLANREGLDDSSRAAFLAWLRHSPAHVGEYMAIVQWDQEMREAAGREPLGTPALVEMAAAEPAVVPLRPHAAVPLRFTPRHAVTPRRRRWPWAAAAGVAAVTFAALVAWQAHAPVAAAGIVYSAPADATRSLTLSDGSRIQLDRGSAIRVQMDDRRRDIAVLGGTLLIDVGHASSAPLSVALGRTVLRDIGTVFQVSSHANGSDVTVLSGRVDVLAPRDGTQDVVAHLQGGQRATLDADGTLTRLIPRSDLTQDLAWLPAEIDFRDAPIADVARRFNDYGQAPLLIEDTSLGQMRISGRFHARDPAGFVAYLQTLPGVNVRRDAEGVHVQRL